MPHLYADGTVANWKLAFKAGIFSAQLFLGRFHLKSRANRKANRVVATLQRFLTITSVESIQYPIRRLVSIPQHGGTGGGVGNCKPNFRRKAQQLNAFHAIVLSRSWPRLWECYAFDFNIHAFW